MTDRELDDLMAAMKEHHEWQMEEWKQERLKELYENWRMEP